MFKFVVLLALVPAILATTGVSQCRDKTPMPESIDILGCLEAPCPVALGTKAQMTVGFIAPRDIKEFSPKVQAGVLGLWVDYPLAEDISTGCAALNGSRCPLSEHEYAVYDFLFPVEESYPKISVQVELSLNDAEGKFSCVSIPVKVVA